MPAGSLAYFLRVFVVDGKEEPVAVKLKTATFDDDYWVHDGVTFMQVFPTDTFHTLVHKAYISEDLDVVKLFYDKTRSP